MQKKEFKRTKVTQKRTSQASSLAKRIFLRVIYLLATSFTSFCYKKRKALFVITSISLLFFSLILSYKYVQAKMAETDIFSDSYVIEKVSQKMKLPNEKPLSLVRVENAEKLQKEHPFYANVKEGDYIIGYSRLFIIYDAVHDEVVGVKESSQKE